VCYRTPSADIYGSGNHNLLREVIGELGSSRKHFVLMGDFNYRFLQWPPLDTSSAPAEGLQFYQALEENFLSQHVECCTRGDAITDEPHMVTDLQDLGHFNGSDHHALSWKLEIRTKQDIATRYILDYSKADTDSMKRELRSIDWDDVLRDLSAADCWNVFKGKLETLERKYIPVKKITAKCQKPIWMTHAAYNCNGQVGM